METVIIVLICCMAGVKLVEIIAQLILELKRSDRPRVTVANIEVSADDEEENDENEKQED